MLITIKTIKLLSVLITAIGLLFYPFYTAFAQTDSEIKIFGLIRDQVGRQPIPGAYVDLRKNDGTQIANYSTGSNGYYEFLISRQDEYNLSITVWEDREDYSLLLYVPTYAIVVDQGTDRLEKNFDLIPAANVILNAYTPSGQLIRRAEMQTLTLGHLYVSNLLDIPNGGKAFAVKDSYSQQASNSWDQSLPSFSIPLSIPNRFHFLWEVPGFGKVMLTIDNQGKGYTLTSPGEYYIIKNVTYEAALSEYARLREKQTYLMDKGFTISDQVLDEIKDSANKIQIVMDAYVSSSPDDPEVIHSADAALKSILIAQESLVLLEATISLTQNRVGNLELKIVDENGSPVEGASVEFEQKSHDFLFGANPIGPDSVSNTTYATLLQDAGINYSYLLFPWGEIEPTPGVFSWEAIEDKQNLKAQESYHFAFMGGLALWFSRVVGDEFSPLYQNQMTFSDLKKNVYEHMRKIAERYKDQITVWEMNEQNASWSNALNLTWNQKFEIIEIAIAGLKAGNPNAKVLFDANALPYEFGFANLNNGNELAGGISFYEFLQQLPLHNIDFDYIGLEFYYSGAYSDSTYPPSLTMAALSDLLDLYSNFGKPIFLRELSAPSIQIPDATWWHQPWDEEMQAEYLKDIYTIAFSKALVQEIGWSYGVSDRDQGPVIGGGILDENDHPKASYFELKKLLTNDWNSKGSKRTGPDGLVNFRGFAGNYSVTVTAQNGIKSTSLIHNSERKENTATIVLPSPNKSNQIGERINKFTALLKGVSLWLYLLAAFVVISIMGIFFLKKQKRS